MQRPMTPARSMALRVHVPAGISILVLTLARIAWWLFADKKPDAASGTPAWQDRIARWVHLAFYVVLLGMAASGIGMLVLSGAGLTIFGGSPLVLPDFQTYPPRPSAWIRCPADDRAARGTWRCRALSSIRASRRRAQAHVVFLGRLLQLGGLQFNKVRRACTEADDPQLGDRRLEMCDKRLREKRSLPATDRPPVR